MRFEFKPCPDCGDRCNQPTIYREVIRDGNDDMVSSVVRAACYTCGWETKGHRNVKECADEWNNTVIYERRSEDEIYDNLPEDTKEFIEAGMLSKSEVCGKYNINNDVWQIKDVL